MSSGTRDKLYGWEIPALSKALTLLDLGPSRLEEAKELISGVLCNKPQTDDAPVQNFLRVLGDELAAVFARFCIQNKPDHVVLNMDRKALWQQFQWKSWGSTHVMLLGESLIVLDRNGDHPPFSVGVDQVVEAVVGSLKHMENTARTVSKLLENPE